MRNSTVQRTIYDGVALSEEMHEKEHFFRSGSYKSDPSVALSCSLTRNPCDERNGLEGTKLSRFTANCLDRDGASLFCIESNSSVRRRWTPSSYHEYTNLNSV